METKLAEFRKQNVKKTSSINGRELISRLTSIISFSSTKSSETKLKEDEKEEEEEEEESFTNWKIIVIKLLLWLTLLLIFIRLEFGSIYFIVSLLYLIWSSLGSRRRRQRDQLSAYSVFNPNFEKLQGTFSAEDYDRQLRRGGSPFFSSSS
jgi:hypothetical protein